MKEITKIKLLLSLVVLVIIFGSLTIKLVSCKDEDNNNSDESISIIIVDDVKSNKYYSITEEEREMLARLVFLESSVCSDECQRAVASVVFNRLESGKWGDTLEEVIYYPNAFTPADKISTTTYPNKSAYDAVDYVINNGPTVPTQVRYFRADHDFTWNGYVNYIEIDNVYFGYFTKWQEGVW